MLRNFEKDLAWFTKKLLAIRLTEVKGFGLPIPFKLSYIEERITDGSLDAKMRPKEHLEELVEEIRQFYIENSGNTANGDRIKLVYLDHDLLVKIYGIDSNLLRTFLVKRLRSNTSLFETRAGGELFYIESSTGVILNAAQQTIVAHLRSAEARFLSYNEIFEICANQKGGEKERAYRAKHATKPSKDSVARSAISDLLKRIKKSEILKGFKNEEIIDNKNKKGYQLMM